MAPGANLVVVGDSLFPTGNVVRIVASGASKPALALKFALQKALRFPESVARLGDFEAGVLTRRAIESHLEVCQWLPGHIGERSPIEADDRVRQFFIRC